MKLTKKKVFVVALAVCLVAILSMGTLAWFNDADEITNQFLIADSDGDGTPDFKVDVYETDPETGDKVQDGNVYEDIAPGDNLKKDPQVFNAGDYDQWIRVYVTFDEWSVIEAACKNQGITTDLRTWLLGLDDGIWAPVDGETVIDEQANTITYVYYYNAKLLPGETVKLFKEVAIPGEFEQDDMKFANGDFTINVKAEALQADNTGDNAQKAFAQYWGK